MVPKVSIIIPVYNVEKTLGRCVQSVIDQTYRDIEIILVDDASTDTSGTFCDHWKSKDIRIRVVHKNRNEGLGEARNTGIDHATGKYICFCDSDDFIQNTAIEKCVSFAEEHNAELVHYGFRLLDPNLREKGIITAEREYIFTGKDVRERFIPGMLGADPQTGKPYGVWMSLCGSFILLDLIKRCNWKCESERKVISEDMYSLLELYSHVETAGIIPYALYAYVQNSQSLTHTFRRDRYQQIESFYYLCVNRCRELGYDGDCERLLSKYYIDYTVAAVKQIVNSHGPLRNKFDEMKRIENASLLQSLFHESEGYNIGKRILLFCMQKKWTFASYLLCRMKR